MATILLALYRFVPFSSVPQTLLDVGTISVSSSGDVLSVTTSVRNPSQKPTIARVFWLLAAAGDGSDWERRAYQSGLQSIQLAPHESRSVEWAESTSIPPGDYRVSAWAHTPGRSGFAHAGTARGPVVTVESGAALFRIRPAPEGVKVTAISSAVKGWGPVTVTATVDVVNGSDEPVTASLSVSLVPLGDRPLDRWWRGEDAMRFERRPVTLARGQSTQITVEQLVALAPGSYLVRATIESAVLGDAGQLDDVAAARLLSVG